MIKIIIEGLKLAPRFLWQLYIQPSKVCAFVKADRKNIYTSTWAFFFIGLFVGTVLAIPHYFLYHDLYQSISVIFSIVLVFLIAFAGTRAHAFAVAFASAVTVTFSGVFAFTFAFAGAFAGAVAVSVALAFAVAGVFSCVATFAVVGVYTVAGIGLFAVAGIFFKSLSGTKSDNLAIFNKIVSQPYGRVILIILFLIAIVLFYLGLKEKKKTMDIFAPLVFASAFIFLFLMFPPPKALAAKYYEAVLFPVFFLIGYLFHSFIADAITAFIKNEKSYNVKISIKFQQAYAKFQKSGLLWSSTAYIMVHLLTYSTEKIKFSTPVHIVAIGFVVIPLFISHVPDYLICLPLWARQRRQILGNIENQAGASRSYENSVLFRHERLFFQLPGLYKIMIHVAGNKECGLNEAAKRIMHLYSSTFQQKQAEKAVLELAKNKEITHHVFLALLESNGIPLIEKISTVNPLASLYHALTDIENNKRLTASMRNNFFTSSSSKKPEDKNLSRLQRKDIFKSAVEEKREYIPKPLEERIDIVCRMMSEEKDYRCNKEMIKTLEACRQFMIAENFQDIIKAIGTLQDIKEFPREIKYFSFFDLIMPRLNRVKESLQKIDAIERMETRRAVLFNQKKDMETILGQMEHDLFEPFKCIWAKGLKQCMEILDREINILQGSAVLAIQLKNNDIPASEDERKLYFEITNKGQELASNVMISIRTVNPDIIFPGGSEKIIDVIESGSVKEISFPIKAGKPIETTVQGTLTFSDRVSIDKQSSFSFPVYVRQMKAEFIKIKNPYIIGQPLKGETPLFYGREDAHDFIDENILASDDHHTFVCHGLRRSGKTSLLYRIETHGFTDKRLSPIYVSMQGIDDEKDFYATLATTIADKLTLHADTAVENFRRFKQFLKEIEPELGERIIVLMVDEFEELQMRVEDGRISRTIFSNLRHLMQHEEKLIFLFCGTHKIEEMAADYWSIFFNTAVYYRLSRLKPQDAIRLIKEPVKDQLTYDSLAVEQILKMTGAQPYLIQLVCRTLVNTLNEKRKRNDALIDDVDDAVDTIIKGGTEHFSQHIWDDATTFERLVLSALAEELTHTQADHMGVDGIYNKIQAVSSSFTRKQMMETLGKLVSREILTEKGMVYSFPVHLLRKWIAARYPLRKVREEI